MGWKQAAVAVLLVLPGSCEQAREEAAPSPTAEPRPPAPVTERVRLPVRGDFTVAPAAPDTRLSTVTATRLKVGKGSVGLFALGRPPGPGRCIVEVRLRLFSEVWPELAAEELAIYPSFVVNALGKRDGARYGYSGALLDVRPRAIFDGVVSGWVEWDVTEIVKLWTGRRGFPSNGGLAPRRGPVVLAMRDTDLAPPFASATIASVESRHPPEAFAFVEEGCPPKGRA